jgi:hypothetical protein
MSRSGFAVHKGDENGFLKEIFLKPDTVRPSMREKNMSGWVSHLTAVMVVGVPAPRTAA